MNVILCDRKRDNWQIFMWAGCTYLPISCLYKLLTKWQVPIPVSFNWIATSLNRIHNLKHQSLSPMLQLQLYLPKLKLLQPKSKTWLHAFTAQGLVHMPEHTKRPVYHAKRVVNPALPDRLSTILQLALRMHFVSTGIIVLPENCIVLSSEN